MPLETNRANPRLNFDVEQVPKKSAPFSIGNKAKNILTSTIHSSHRSTSVTKSVPSHCIRTYVWHVTSETLRANQLLNFDLDKCQRKTYPSPLDTKAFSLLIARPTSDTKSVSSPFVFVPKLWHSDLHRLFISIAMTRHQVFPLFQIASTCFC